MALDLSALRNKLTELKGAAGRDHILWKPSKGDSLIRIVPLKDNPEYPFIELYFHNLGGKTYLSPLSFNEPDPIAEFAEKLKADAGGKLPPEDWKEVKKFIPYRRTFVPMIDRNKQSQGVRFWAFGKTVYKTLAGVLTDPEYGDITDPQTGRDIKIEYTPQDESDTGFAKTEVRVKVKVSPLTTDSDELKKLLNEQPDLMSLYKKMTYEELQEVLENYLTPSGGTAPTRVVVNKNDEDWGEDVSESPSAVKAKAASKTTGKDVSDEFAALFEDK